MKLHLPLSLRAALAAGRVNVIAVSIALVSASLCHTAQAEEITISDNSFWHEANSAEYSGQEGDWYNASNIQWNISGGSYFITTTSDDTPIKAIDLNTSASLSNLGELDCKATSTGAGGYAYGIHATDYGTLLTNEKEGFLTVSATIMGTGYGGFAAGVALEAANLTNHGALTTTASVMESQSIAYGIYASAPYSSIANTQSGVILATATSAGGTAYGIYSQISLTNNGNIAVTAQSASRDCTGIYKSGGEYMTNEAGAVLTIKALTTGASSAIDQIYCRPMGISLRSRLYNRGEIEITATATGDESGATGIYAYSGKLDNSGKMTITVEAATGSARGFNSAYSTTQINSGELIITTLSEGSSCGVELYETAVENKQGGVLTINATSSSNSASGISGGSVLNSGRITATAQAVGGSYGIGISGLHNEQGGIIAATATSKGTSAYTDAIALGLGPGSSSHTNDGEIMAIAQSTQNSTGISVGACLLTNAQGGILTAQATSTENAGRSIGFSLTSSGTPSFVNHGEVTTSANAKGDSYGISLSGASLANEQGGIISATAISSQASGSATGIDIAARTDIPSTPPSFDISHVTSSLVNLGEMEATAQSAGDSYGIRLVGAALTNELNSIITTTATTTSAHGSATGISMGVYTYTPTSENEEVLNFVSCLTNKGVITVTAQAMENSCAISLSDSTIINERGACVAAIALSENKLSGFTTGVRLDKNASFFNAGSLKSDSLQVGASASDTSFYMLNSASAGALSENGTMSFSGLGTIYLGGAKSEDNTVSRVVSGSTITATSNLSFYGSSLNLIDNVTLNMGGDLMIADGVTTTWNGNSLTIDNGGTRHSFSMGNEFAGSWSGSFTLRENESGEGFTLTQQKVDKYVSLNLGKVTVGGGVLRATETLELGGADTTMEIASDTDSLVLHGEHGGHVLNAVISAEGVMVSAGEGTQLTLDSSILTLGGGLNVLKNVVIQGSSHIGSVLGSNLSLDLVTFVLGELNSSLGTQAVLAAEDDVALFMTPYTSGGTAMLGTNILENVSVSGDMTLDLSYWADAIAEGGYDSLAFSLGEGVDIADGAQISATLDGVNYATALYSEDNMVQFNVASLTAAIPEPTTATLSLLALTALAARRRRKSAA